MKTLDRQKLHVVNKTRSNPALRDWRGQFTPELAARTAIYSLPQARLHCAHEDHQSGLAR